MWKIIIGSGSTGGDVDIEGLEFVVGMLERDLNKWLFFMSWDCLLKNESFFLG